MKYNALILTNDDITKYYKNFSRLEFTLEASKKLRDADFAIYYDIKTRTIRIIKNRFALCQLFDNSETEIKFNQLENC